MKNINYSKWYIIPENEYQDTIFSKTEESYYNIRSLSTLTKDTLKNII